MPWWSFTSDWPAKIDRQVIEKVDENLVKRISAQRSNHVYNMAKKLGPKAKCQFAIRSLIINDQWLTIARWAEHYSYNMPKLVDHGIWVKSGRHLLLGVGQPGYLRYPAKAAQTSDRQPLALLTGANSGMNYPARTTRMPC